MCAWANELKDGDKDTKYIHHKASLRRRRNIIKGLKNSDVSWRSGAPDTKHIITNYFFQMFQYDNMGDFDKALTGLGCCLTDDMNEWLHCERTRDAIKHALQCTLIKLRSRMVFMFFFFQNFWEVLMLRYYCSCEELVASYYFFRWHK